MATDATGTPTSLGVPKYNTSVDAPSGLGFNAAMDVIDALLLARVTKPSGIVSGEVPVWNGSAFVRSSVTPLSQLGMNGTARKINVGQTTITFTASAQSANPAPDVAHGLGVVPQIVIATAVDLAVFVFTQSGTLTSTNFRLIGVSDTAITGTATVNWVAVG